MSDIKLRPPLHPSSRVKPNPIDTSRRLSGLFDENKSVSQAFSAIRLTPKPVLERTLTPRRIPAPSRRLTFPSQNEFTEEKQDESMTPVTLQKSLSVIKSLQRSFCHSPKSASFLSESILPPKTDSKLTVVLDLDETLIHSEFTGSSDPRQAEARLKATRTPDFSFILYEHDPTMKNEIVYVYKRPGVEQFLAKLAKVCEVVIWTASLPVYADPILDIVDSAKVCDKRLYRSSTVAFRGYPHVKSLKRLGRDLKRTVLIDNSPFAMCADPFNAILIKPFYDSVIDRELDQMFKDILELAMMDDVRPFLHNKYNFLNVLDVAMSSLH